MFGREGNAVRHPSLESLVPALQVGSWGGWNEVMGSEE